MYRIKSRNQFDDRLSFDGQCLDILGYHKQIFFCRNPEPPEDVVAVKLRDNASYYSVIDSNGYKLFDALEYRKTFTKRWCGDLRSFEMSILRTDDQEELLRFQRPFRGDCCFCVGFRQSMDIIQFPECSIIGKITQEWTVCRPRFAIKMPYGEVLFYVTGECCSMRCCVRELDFSVTTIQREQIALISSQWTGLLRDDFENEQFYGVQFKQHIDTRVKALVMGACFLINALYYQI